MSPVWVAAALASELPRDIAAAAFVEGRWHSPTQEEHWVRVGDVVVGVGFTKTGFELLRIDARAGVLQYVAQPRGGGPVTFSCTGAAADTVVFENPSHDWPKRLAYSRKNDVLTAAVGVGGPEDLQLKWRPVKTLVPFGPPSEVIVEPEVQLWLGDEPLTPERFASAAFHVRAAARSPWAPLAFTLGEATLDGVTAPFAAVWRDAADGSTRVAAAAIWVP